ncbi:MAG TPA: hypothetical protein PKH93_10895, partial [Chitinophagales bacterium]|nr:hypothetical protein [Chitinophagales bacterium]
MTHIRQLFQYIKDLYNTSNAVFQFENEPHNVKQKNAQWVRRADLPADGRCSIAFAPINDRFYLFGGFVYPPF